MRQTLQQIALAISVTAAPAVFAQSGAEIMLTPWQEGQIVQTRVDAFYTPTEADVSGADVDLSIFDAVGRVRLHPDSSYNPTIGFAYTRYELGSADAALPDELTDVSVAFGGSFGEVDLGESFYGTWRMGYTVGVGYAGTNPFADSDDLYFKADVFGIRPVDQDSSWLVGINYDGNRVFLPDVPLPAVTYFGRLNETLTYGIGVPYSSLTWKPDDRWTIDVKSLLFISLSASVRYNLGGGIELFSAYVQRSDAFAVSGVEDRRFLFSQQRLEAGVSYELCDNAELVLAGGFAFGQEFDIGYDSRDPTGLRDLDDSGYIRGGIVLRY